MPNCYKVRSKLYSANIPKAENGRKNKEKNTINRALYFSLSMRNWVDKMGKGVEDLTINFKNLTDNEQFSVKIYKILYLKCLWNINDHILDHTHTQKKN